MLALNCAVVKSPHKILATGSTMTRTSLSSFFSPVHPIPRNQSWQTVLRSCRMAVRPVRPVRPE